MEMKFKRFLSFVLALTLVLSYVPVGAFAAETEDNTTIVSEETPSETPSETPDDESEAALIAEEETVTTVTNEAELAAALTTGGDVVLSAMLMLSNNIVIPEGVTVALDLGGTSLMTDKYYIENNGTLTVKNGSLVASTFNDDTNGAPLLNKGTLTVDGANISGVNAAIRTEAGNVTINSGTLSATADNGKTATVLRVKGGNVVIHDGSFVGCNSTNANGAGCHLITATAGTVTIYGGSFSDVAGQTMFPYGNVTVYGGTFTPGNTDGFTIAACLEDALAPGYEVSEAGVVTKIPAQGNNFTGYTSTDGIWGEVWGNASESFVIKVLDANGNVMGTTSLNNIDGIIDGDVNVSWNLKLDAASNTDEYWTMEWTTAPSLTNVPAKVELWVDGEKVSGGNVVLNGPDDLHPVFAAKVDESGKILSYIACDGFNLSTASTKLQSAINAGDNVAILVAGTYTVPSGKDCTITGAVNGVAFGTVGAWNMGGASITFNNVTFNYAPDSAYKGLQHCGDMVYNNCTFMGQVFLYGNSETFNGCTFVQTDANNYNVWTYGAKVTNFNNCTFNCAGKSVLVYHEGASHNPALNVVDCDFVASKAVEGKAAIEIDTSLMAGASIVVDDKTTVNETFGTGSVSGSQLWNDKKADNSVANGGTTSTVVVAGETVKKAAILGLAGEGTETSPYLIGSLEELLYFAEQVNGGNTYSGKYVKLNDDIDLGSMEWEPITGFKGVFDGGNHTISNLFVNKAGISYVGFFGKTSDGELKNITFHNATVIGRLAVGVLAGQPFTSNITNVTLTGKIVVEGMSYVGGVAGRNVYGKVTNVTVNASADSYVKATSTENGVAYRTYVGGVVGFMGEDSAALINVTSNINVIGDVCDIGGITGIAHYGTELENVTFTGSVTAPEGAEEVGGIAGVWHNQAGTSVSFTNVTSTGTVTVGDEDVSATNGLTGGAYNAGNDTVENSGSLVIDGTAAWPLVVSIGDIKYGSLKAAAEAAQSDDEIVLLANITVTAAETVELNGVTLKGNGFALTNDGTISFTDSTLENVIINGTGTAKFYGENEFNGENQVIPTTVNGGPFHLIVNKGATLLISRFVLGYDRNITVYGEIEDATALTAEDVANLPLSLKFNSTSGVSVGGTGTGNLTVVDAYVELGNSSWKNAQGTYDWTFTNSYVSATSFTQIAVCDASWNVTFDDSVLAAKNYIKVPAGATYSFTNGSVATTGSMKIDGVLNIDETSSVTATSQQNNKHGAASEHEDINGTVNVAGTLNIGGNSYMEVLIGELNVNGGTVNITSAKPLHIAADGTVNVNSGTITGDVDVTGTLNSTGSINGTITAAEGATITINAGTYTQDVTEWCADGYIAKDNGDGTYSVKAEREAWILRNNAPKFYGTLAEAIADAQAGETIILCANIEIFEPINIDKNITIADYGNLTVSITGNGGISVVNDAEVVFDDFIIDISGAAAKGDCIIGVGNYSTNGKLTLTNMDVTGNGYSSAYAVFYVYNTSTLNFNNGSVNLSNDKSSAGGFIKAEQGKDGIVNITGTNIDLTDAKIGFLDGTVTLTSVGLNINGGANAINQSALTVVDSIITIDGADGRALTLSQGDVTIINSTLEFSNCSEGEIRFKKGLTLSIDETSTISDCTVYADASAVGAANVNGEIVTGSETNKSEIVDGTVVNPDWAAKVGNAYYATISEALTAAQAGDTVTIFAGEYTQNLSVNKDITVVGEGEVKFNGQLSITADGATVKNMNFQTSGNAGYISAKDVLVEGCSVVGSNGFRYCYTSGTVTFKDSTITGATYGIHFDGDVGGNIVIENCDITGWTSFAGTIEKVTMTDTEFLSGNYNQLRFYQDVEMTNCVFNPDMTIDFGTNEVSADFTGCSVSDGSSLLDVIYLADQAKMGIDITIDDEPVVVVAMIGNECYLSIDEAFAAAKDGDTITVYADATLTEVVELNNTSLTIDGTGKLTINDANGNNLLKVYGETTLNISCGLSGEVWLGDGADLTDSTINGNVFVAGNVTFSGDNTVAMLYDFGELKDYYGSEANMKWTVEKGASLTLTSKSRHGLGYGDNITIYGSLEDALTARENLTEDDLSLFMHGSSLSSGNWSNQSYLTVEDAYVIIGDNNSLGTTTAKGGDFFLTFKNSVLTTSRLTNNATGSNVHFVAENSDLQFGSAWSNLASGSTTKLTNSKLAVIGVGTNGTDVYNCEAGTMTLVNSSLSFGDDFTINGTIEMDLGSLITAPAVTGTGKIVVDATGFSGVTAYALATAGGLKVIDADMSGFTGEIEVLGAVYTADENGLVIEAAEAKVGETYYANLDEVFADSSLSGEVTVELLRDATAHNKVNVSYAKNVKYNFVTSVEGGVEMNFEYDSNWNNIPHFSIGENITMNIAYLNVIGGDINVSGTINTNYFYLYGTGKGVTIEETGVVNATTEEATVQVKGGTVLTVKGELNTNTLNVWTSDSNASTLKVSGSNAKVTASHIHAWNGGSATDSQKIIVENGASLTSSNLQADRNSEITVDGAKVAADKISLGYDNNVGKLNVVNGGEIELTNNGKLVVSGNSEVTLDETAKTNLVASVIDANGVETHYTSLSEAMTAAQAGDTVVISAGEYTQNLSVNKAITVIGETDAEGNNLVKINGGISITADGAAVKNLTASNPATSGYNMTLSISAGDVLVEGCEITDHNAVRYSKAKGLVTFKDCVITGSTYGIHFDGDVGGEIVIDGCTITGWTSFASTIEKVTITDTEFAEGTYNFIRFYQKEIVIDGCTFNEKMGVDVANSVSATVTVTNSTLENGNVEDLFENHDIDNGEITVDGVRLITPEAVINGIEYDDLAAAVAAVKDGETIELLPVAQTEGATIKLPASLKNVTIKGAEGAVLKNTTIMAADGNSISYEGLTFDGITFENSRISITGWRTGGASVKDLTVTNCVFKNLDDSSNSAPVHINMGAEEAVVNFTFTNNVIDGATGGSKSGIYAQATGNVTVSGNVINNVSFRPYVIQITTDDGIADNFVVTGNTFSGSAAGRAQALGNNNEGTDNVNLVVTGNIFKDITSAQQICYWNFNEETTTADLSKNYYDIDLLNNPSRIYYNSPAQNAQDLQNMGIYPYYADEAMTELVYAPAIMVTYPDGTVEYYEDMLEAVPYTTNCPRLEGATVTLLSNIEAAGIRMMENDMVLDLNGHTYTITAGTGSQGTNTSGFQIRPEVTTVATIKNGTIKVAEGAPVVWMFNNYATNFVVEDVTVDCTNMAYSYGESCYVHVSRSGDNTEFVGSTQIINFNSEVAGNAINVGGSMTIGENVVPGGTIELDSSAVLTAREGLDVVTVDGYKVVYANGVYTSVSKTSYVTNKAELDAAIANAIEDDIIVLANDIDYGTTQLAINKTITIDLGGYTLTTGNNYGGMSLKGNPTIKNGNIVHVGRTAAIKAWNVASIENVNITVAANEPGKTIGGIVIQSGATNRIGSIKNVTIQGEGLTNGIETYNCGNAEQNVIGSMENVTIKAQSVAMLISAPCGTATNCTFEGGKTGIELWIKSTYSATLDLVDCTVSGGEQAVNMHDEYSSNPSIVNNGTLKLTADEATSFASESGAPLTLTIARAENVDYTLTDKLIAETDVRIGDTYYYTLEDAVKAATAGETITLLKDIALTESLVINKEGAYIIDGNGHKITQAEGFKDTQVGLIMLGSSTYGDAEAATHNVTIKNVVFDGISNTSVIRAQGVTLTMDGCEVVNTVDPKRNTVIRLDYTEATIKNSKFDNNGDGMVVVHNYNADPSQTKLNIDNCVFSNNNVELNSAVVYYVTGSGCTITNSEFIGNNVNSNVNAATLYLGFQDNCVVTGNLFKDNTVKSNSTRTRVAGAIMIGYEAEISGNAFENNSASNNNGSAGIAQDVCASTYYTAIDLSGNYWDGDPNNSDSIYNEYAYNPVEIQNYFQSYSFENGVLTLGDEVVPVYVAAIGEFQYTSLQAAIDAAAAGETVKLLAETTGAGVVIDKNVTINLNGFTYTVNKCVGSVGTATLGFQILKGNDVTITNGTLAATAVVDGKSVKILVQNYANLTLKDVTLDGTGSADMLYVLSNNSGNVSITGATNITAPEGTVAFDVYDYSAAGYTAPVVTVDTTGTVTGKIEVSKTATLAISGGVYTVPVADSWCANGFVPTDNGDGTYGVIEAAESVAELNGTYYYASIKEAIEVAQNDDVIKVLVDHTVESTIIVDKSVTIELNGKTLTGSANPVIRVKEANVIVQGGNIVNENGYCFIVGASDADGGELTIKNGNYRAQTTVASVTKGYLTIEGGYFVVDAYTGAGYANYNFLLNCIDAYYKTGEAGISVKGGSFENFNPANNAAEGIGTNFVDPMYKSTTVNGTVWTVTAYEAGETAENPIDLTEDLLYEGDFSATVTVPAGKTYHFCAYRVGGMLMSINGSEAVTCVTDGMWYPYAWTITNDGAADAEYVITVSYPAGNQMNPAELVIGDNTATIEAGNTQGYYFTWTATFDGALTITMPEGGWMYTINNLTAYRYGDTQWSDSDPIVNPAIVEFAEGDELQIIVSTYDPANPWSAPEGELTFNVAEGYPAGYEQNPIDLTEDLLYEDDFSATVTVPAGKTYHFCAYRVGGMLMSINGGEAVTCVTDGMWYPYAWTITNDGAADAEYVITISYPAGNQMNPAQLVIGDNTATIEAGNTQGYYFTWIATDDGELTITMPEGNWMYTISNLTTYTYGETQWSDSDPVVNPAVVAVNKGDELQIMVNGYDPADMWNTPAGDIVINAEFVAAPGTEANPIGLFAQENTVTAAGTSYDDVTYYYGFFGGMNLTVSGNGEFSVLYNGNTYTAVNGVVTIEGLAAMGRMPVNFAIDGNGEYTISAAYPVGNMQNPAQLVIGDNTATIEAGNTQGYYFTWIATDNGELTITMPEGNWMFVVNNMTTYAYGDTQWSDAEPQNPYTIVVNEGDEIQVMVNGYDPADMWNTPAGDIVFTAEFMVPIAQNTTTGVKYGSVSEALAVAKSGETVILLADAEEDLVYVRTGRTLDLNGKTLTANDVIAVKGAHIVDAPRGGLLKIAEESIVLSETNKEMALWNGEGYVFGTFRTTADAAPVLNEDGTMEFKFYMQFSGVLQNLIKDNGTSDNNVSVVIRLNWFTEDGAGNQEFVYNDDQIKQVAQGGYSFNFKVYDYDVLSQLTLTTAIVSETGVESVGTTYQITE